MKKHLVWLLVSSTTLLSCYKPQMDTRLKDNALANNKTDATALLAGINYYVSATGDDAADGSLGTPFRTINKALTVVAPGDTVFVRGGTYNEKVHFPVSGVKGSFITLKEYPGETTIISGAGLTVNGDEGLVTIDSAQYIVIDGLDICNFKSSSANPRGILITGGSDFVRIKNNQLYGIDYQGAPQTGNSYGILFHGRTADRVSDIQVDNNTIRDCSTGTGSSLAALGEVASFTFSNNTLYNGENTGISVAGVYENGAFRRPSAGIIQANTVYNVPGYGIEVLGMLNTTIERNRISNAGQGIHLAGVPNYQTSNVNYIVVNIIYHCQGSGIVLGTPGGVSTAGTQVNYVVNNTLFHNNQLPASGTVTTGELCVQSNAAGNFIHDNIVYASPVDAYVSVHNAIISTAANLYFTTGTAQWLRNGASINDLVAWRALVGGETNSFQNIDPLLVNTSAASPDLHLQAGSPARNNGVKSTYNGQLDIDGQSRYVGVIDRGADELP